MAAIYLNGFHGMIHLSRRYEWQIYTHISIANTHLYLCRIEWKRQRLIARSFDNFVWLLFIRWAHSWLVLGACGPSYCVSCIQCTHEQTVLMVTMCPRWRKRMQRPYPHRAFPKVQMLLMTFNRHWFAILYDMHTSTHIPCFNWKWSHRTNGKVQKRTRWEENANEWTKECALTLILMRFGGFYLVSPLTCVGIENSLNDPYLRAGSSMGQQVRVWGKMAICWVLLY